MDSYGQQSNGAYTPDSYAYSLDADGSATTRLPEQGGYAPTVAVDEMDLAGPAYRRSNARPPTCTSRPARCR